MIWLLVLFIAAVLSVIVIMSTTREGAFISRARALGSAIFWLCSAAMLLLLTYYFTRSSYELYSNGEEAIATVGEHYRFRHGRRTTSHYHTLTYAGFTNIETDLHRQYAPGTQFDVLYVPDDPSIYVLGGKSTDSLFSIMKKNGASVWMLSFSLLGGLYGLYQAGAFAVTIVLGPPKTPEDLLIRSETEFPSMGSGNRSDTRQDAFHLENKPANFTKDDMVFIRMHVDKETVFEGEPVQLTMQLWRIRHPDIESGPRSGGRIQLPGLVGLTDARCDQRFEYDSERNGRPYRVDEVRKTLRPMRVGIATIGEWRWEGVAIAKNPASRLGKNPYFDLVAGPITLKVQQSVR